MSWIDKILPTGVRKDEGPRRASVPEGLWKKCVKCDAVLYRPDVERNDDVVSVALIQADGDILAESGDPRYI